MQPNHKITLELEREKKTMYQQPTPEIVEDLLLEFLDITQLKLSNESFPINLKSKWIEFKKSQLNIVSPVKKIHTSSKSQTEAALKARVYSQEKREYSNNSVKRESSNDNSERQPQVSPFTNFTMEFKNLMKTVNDNTNFYENLAFKQNGDMKSNRTEGIDPLNFYIRSDMLLKEKK